MIGKKWLGFVMPIAALCAFALFFALNIRNARIEALNDTAAPIMRTYAIDVFEIVSIDPLRILCEDFESLENKEKLVLLTELTHELGLSTEICVGRGYCYYAVTREQAQRDEICRRAGLYYRKDGAIWFIYAQ